MGPNRSGIPPEQSQTLLGHFWKVSLSVTNLETCPANHETSTSRKTVFFEKSYKSFKPEVFPPPWIQNITGNFSLKSFFGVKTSRYKQSSVPTNSVLPIAPPRLEGLWIQKFLSFGKINSEDIISLGAFHLKTPFGGRA